MTKSRDLFTTVQPYVTSYDAIYKMDSTQIWVSVSLLSIFFYRTLHMWARMDEEHNYEEKHFTFQTWTK